MQKQKKRADLIYTHLLVCTTTPLVLSVFFHVLGPLFFSFFLLHFLFNHFSSAYAARGPEVPTNSDGMVPVIVVRACTI